ncbi:hypothetical protein M5689_006591 [Euphorbia peplus]|nr:hypothetical protein M5689_006591 [Euphorbia peplus]
MGTSVFSSQTATDLQTRTPIDKTASFCCILFGTFTPKPRFPYTGYAPILFASAVSVCYAKIFSASNLNDLVAGANVKSSISVTLKVVVSPSLLNPTTAIFYPYWNRSFQ